MRQLITEHAADVSFFAPDTACAEAREHLPALLERRGVNGAVAMVALSALEIVLGSIDVEPYQPLEQQALAH